MLRTGSRSLVDRVGGVPQVFAGHQVGVGVVVDDGGVLVRPGDAVDAEAPVVPLGEEAEVVPEPGGLDEDLGAVLAQELLVAGDVDVLLDAQAMAALMWYCAVPAA